MTRAIRKLGMPVWCPMHEAPSHRIELLFPRYLLIQADLAVDGWRRIYSLPGVETVLGIQGRPTPLPPGSLDLLFAACDVDGVMYLPEPVRAPRPRIARGTVVTVEAGQFAGWVGVCRWSSRKRVAVLLSLLGREVQVLLPRDDVTPS